MDTRLIGSTIAKLRKRNGLTQVALAKKLNVSDKTISKWENGLGYPEITQFPALAALFGVSIDYLMTGERNGITIAGNMIVDAVKNINLYPEKGMLAEISDVSKAVGGCAPNTAIDLTKIDRSVPISVAGCIGDDDDGRFLLGVMQQNGVNTNMVTVTDKAFTAFSDVMSLPNGERTFFTYRGANALFSPENVNIEELKCKILHIGYILLLDKFDMNDDAYGTVMARFLHDVKERGIQTCIDVVSNSNCDYGEKIIPALKYADYVVINEIECCNIWGFSPRFEDGSLDVETIRLAMEKMIDAGVSQKVIIHAKEAGFCLSVNGEFTKLGSLVVDSSLFKGSVGAGDAFCAGCLYGIYNGYSDLEILEFASAAALCNLFEVNAVDGMRSRDEIMEIKQKYERYPI